MIAGSTFVSALVDRGFRTFSGVPCSYLTPLINTVIDSDQLDYVAAANEGDAIAIAAGSQLAGRPAVVLFQNSGLGNAVNPITSLTYTFRVPILVITTWRGQPDRPADEPQHHLMGQITPQMLETMQLPTSHLPETEEELPALLDSIDQSMAAGQAHGLIVSKGIISGDATPRPHPPREIAPTPTWPTFSGAPFDPDETMRTLVDATEDAIVIATTGFTGRALYAAADRDNHFYMVGSMGCASSLGLGLARAHPQRRVVVLDGDGAFLMRMGAAATVGAYAPPNLTHVLLDNQVHDSTGSQATVAPAVDFAGIAHACGYPHVSRALTLDALASTVREAEGLTFVHVRTLPRPDRKLPRPTITPAEVADRLRGWISSPR